MPCPPIRGKKSVTSYAPSIYFDVVIFPGIQFLDFFRFVLHQQVRQHRPFLIIERFPGMRCTKHFLCIHTTVFLKCPVPADDTLVFIDDKLRDGRALDNSLEFPFTLPNYLFAIFEFIILGTQFFF